MKKTLATVGVLTLLSSCATFNPAVPETEIPHAWKENVKSTRSYALDNHFWEYFEDPILNALESEAIAANFDLQIAVYRIQEARALVSREHSKRLPQVTLNASATADETLLNPRSYGSPRNLERVQQREYDVLADFAYEIDFWGKFKAQETGARMRQEAASWEYEFVYQTVVTEVAARYFSLRTLEEEIECLTQAICNRQNTVSIHECRVEAGFDPTMDLARAKLNLALAEADLEAVKKHHAIEHNALVTLLGRPASSWSLPPGKLPAITPPIPAILPSEVLMRRADVQQQLALVAAGRSDVDVALKDYFPSFPLTAALGLCSPVLSNLFEWQARYWQYAFNALAPVYDGGRRKANVAGAKARFHATFATYQNTVNRAFQDVEDALSTLHYSKLQYEAQGRALLSARDTALLSKDRYETGLISYLLVADSENMALDVARRSIALRGGQLLAWLRLMRALGIQRES
jgi:multidrug efflux system outer membrane protein